MKKIVWFVLLACLAVLLWGCGADGLPEKNQVEIAGVLYPMDAETLDLRGVQELDLECLKAFTQLRALDLRETGIDGESYEALQAAMPGCSILWSVPFRDGYVSSDAETVTVTTLTDADLAALEYLDNLKRVDGTGCTDYGMLQALQSSHPQWQVDYTLQIDGQAYAPDAQCLTMARLDWEILAKWRPFFPNLNTVVLTGIQENGEELLDIMEANPDVVFNWNMDLLGVTVNSLAEEIDISGAQVEDLAALEAMVIRFPNVKKVVMCDCGISNEDMDALNRRHEDIQFVWAVTILHVTLRTDITYLMPHQYNLWPTTAQSQDYKYFTELICLDLGHQGISNCDFVAYMPKLQYLLLGDTGISDLTPLEGLEDLVYLEIFMTEVRDYTPLLKLKKLECLNLTYTYGQADIVAQLTWVDYIRWITSEERMLTPQQFYMLQERLPDTLLELGVGQSSTGGMWRQTQRYFEQRDILGMEYMTG